MERARSIQEGVPSDGRCLVAERRALDAALTAPLLSVEKQVGDYGQLGRDAVVEALKGGGVGGWRVGGV